MLGILGTEGKKLGFGILGVKRFKYNGMGGSMRTYKDLMIWQKAMSFVTEIYTTTKTFPRDEHWGLVSQIRRSSVSIPCNIAEGYGRNSTKDYTRFLRITMGSIYEIQTQLEISKNLEYLHNNTFENLYELSREIERMLSSLIKKIREE